MPQSDDGTFPEPANIKLILGAIMVTLILASLGQTTITPALPIIVGDLGGIEQISWAFTSYLLATTVAAPISGKLGDMFGRKIVFQVGIAIFALGSIAAAMSVNMGMLVACRLIQGIGAGSLIVTSMAAVGDVLPPRKRGKVQGLIGAAFGVSTVVVEALNWRWLFFVNLPVAVLSFAVISLAFETRAKGERRSIDFLGAGLLAVTLSSVVLYASLGGTFVPWLSIEALSLLVVSAVALVAFVVVERNAKEPILPLFLFRNNAFLVSNGVGLIVGTVMFGTITFLPSYLLIVKGFSPTMAGLGVVPMMIGLIVTSTLAGQVMSRTGRYKHLPIISTAILSLGAFMLSTISPDTPYPLIGLYATILGVGIGPVMSVGVVAIQNAVPKSVLGVGTASANMFRQIGGSFGVAVLGAVFANRLLQETAAIGHPEGSAGFEAAALAALPVDERTLMLGAYVEALSTVFFVAGVVALSAFLLGWALREIPLSDSAPAERDTEAQAAE